MSAEHPAVLEPPYDGWAEWHKHFFVPDGDDCPIYDDDPEIEDSNETVGRYDAVEDRLGRIFVLKVEDWEVMQVCAGRDEACRIAKAMATI